MRFHRLRIAMLVLRVSIALGSASALAQPAPGVDAVAPRLEIDRGAAPLGAAAPELKLATAAGRERS